MTGDPGRWREWRRRGLDRECLRNRNGQSGDARGDRDGNVGFLDFSSEASHQKCDPTLISVSMEGWGYSHPRQIICDL